MTRAFWLADAIRAEGVTVVEEPGWRERGRAGLRPRAIVLHHTASGGGDAPALGIVKNGRSDLPGPLCHVLLSRSGVAHIVASGVANHAGRGGWRGVSGNSHALGIEAENNGVGEPWPDYQMSMYVRVVTAMCRRARIDPSMVCGHKEWTPRKIDPTFDCNDFRARVADRLANAGEFTMDAQAVAAFRDLNRRLDTFEKDRLEPTTRRVRELKDEVAELRALVEQLVDKDQ